MRTRRSNRAKRYTEKKYSFDDSSAEEEVSKRDKNADANDENFDGAAAAVESEDDQDLALDDEAPESDASVSDPDAADRFSRQRVKPIRPFNVRAVGVTGYLEVEPVADGRIVRSYCGLFDRAVRGNGLIEAWYSRFPEGFETASRLLERWMQFRVLPPKARSSDDDQGDRIAPWSPKFFDQEAYNAEQWYERVQDSMPSHQDAWRELSDQEAAPYRLRRAPIPVWMGPHDAQQDIDFETGAAYSISQSGLPLEQDGNEAKIPSGWMFDVGGIIIAMDWARTKQPGSPQVLALCIIPYSDQEYFDFEQESMKPDFHKHGIVQLWEFRGERTEEGYMRPSSQPPRLRKTLCFDRGRARRVKWSPACGMLAVICGDGSVCVVAPGDDGEGGFAHIEQPIATFAFTDEDSITATALTWINFNRLVVGYSDGSIALWSIRPKRLLSRIPVHHNAVVDLASGYPAMPYLIASSPIGGTSRLIDLRNPSSEMTEVQALTVTTQPNLLAYSDHLLGFFSLYPSAGPLKTLVGFMYHAHYPIVRRIFTGQSFNTCLSVGSTHPYLLIGSLDGSLWALNPQVEIFNHKRGEHSDRIRLFHHEHLPKKRFQPETQGSQRGASRIVQGFMVEKNVNPTTHVRPQPKKGKKKKKKDDEAGGPDGEDEDEGAGTGDPTRGVVYEPLSRVTVVEWNPNGDYGCWAAAAMASGLVRVMDLGLEMPDNPV